MKEPRCPLADKWIRKLWYIYTMGYYSAIKKNAFESVLMRWIKLERSIQSIQKYTERSKSERKIPIQYIYGIQKDGNNDPICEMAKETQI